MSGSDYIGSSLGLCVDRSVASSNLPMESLLDDAIWSGMREVSPEKSDATHDALGGCEFDDPDEVQSEQADNHDLVAYQQHLEELRAKEFCCTLCKKSSQDPCGSAVGHVQ